MDRNNEIIPKLDPEHVRLYTSDSNKEIDNPDVISMQFKKDNLIRQLHVLQAIIQPIITAGDGALIKIEQIEAKVKEF